MKYSRQTPCIYKNIRTVFHGIPKNASTSVKNALYEIEHGREFGSDKQWIHKGNHKGGSIYPDVACIQSKFSDWYHFAVVRNPVDRFKSFYLDLFARKASGRIITPPFYRDNKIKLAPTSIDNVIDIIERFDDEEADEHFASQSSFIYADNIHIIKIEDIEDNWKEVTSRLNVEYKPLNVYNQSKRINLELTVDQVQRIYKRYTKDFESFNYGIV